MASIFLTGATGYVGGHVLHTLSQAHPEYAIAALIRDSEAAKRIDIAYANVRAVVADLDNSAVVEEEANKANIVLHLASNKHLGSFQAIERGLASKSEPSYWVQVSGFSALSIGELSQPDYKVGQPSSKVWDDLNGVAEIRDQVREYSTIRVVDNYLLDTAKKYPGKINTAIVMPPIIFGQGLGPGNTRSVQLNTLARNAVKRGQAVRLGPGEGAWSNIHVNDISNVVHKLVDVAIKPEGTDPAIWGETGVYTPSTTFFLTWKEISDKLAGEGKKLGLLKTADVEEIDEATATSLGFPGAKVFFASNAKSKANRERDLLGWKPAKEDAILEEFSRVLKDEADRLGPTDL